MPGEVIIESLEEHGLPAPIPDSESTAQLLENDPNTNRSKASALRLVRAHVNGARFLSSFRKLHHSKERQNERDVEILDSDLLTTRPSGRKKGRFGRGKHNDRDGGYALDDIEHRGESRQAHAGDSTVGSGVLSALLSLYGRHSDSTSGWATPSQTRGDETPYSIGSMTPTPESDQRASANRGRSRDSRQKYETRAPRSSTAGTGKQNGGGHFYRHRKTHSASSINVLCRSVADGLDRLTNAIPQMPRAGAASIGSAIHKLPGVESRPPQARSSAGVLGALIASTGNISGAAAPENCKINPDPKRPGFHLSRFESLRSLPCNLSEILFFQIFI